MKGLIIKAISGTYDVLIEDTIVTTKPKGLFRHQNTSPKVGDFVDVEANVIVNIYPRKNDFIRPNIANVDKVFITTSIVEPELNLNLLDRLICLSEYYDVKSVLVFTKDDLTTSKIYLNTISYYKELGYRCYILPEQTESLLDEINQNICVLAGQSGVGKSTLLNRLDQSLNIRTDAISKALNRGKHTTRHVELLKIKGGWIADTPGFGILDLEMNETSLSHTFVEFFNTSCRFSKCLHIKEPGCMVRDYVKSKTILPSRYENYLMFIEEIRKRRKC